MLTTLVTIDKEDHANAAIILAFCKFCGDDYAGLIPRKMRLIADKNRYEIPQSDLLPADKQKNVRQLLKDYFTTLCRHLQSEYIEVQSVERTNRRILLTKGEVREERKEQLESLQANYAKLLTITEQMADLLDEDMPELKEPQKSSGDIELEEAEMEAIEVEASLLGNVWEDDETKSFYEDLVCGWIHSLTSKPNFISLLSFRMT